VLDPIVTPSRRSGRTTRRGCGAASASAGFDVYENDGKRSGAYSRRSTACIPYMLMNWADTLDDVFTLAHEMGHSMHTMLSHERQPFVYSDYTIFVAEVPSTLSEALLLEHLLARVTDRDERIVLLQHAIDNITSTFYTQVLFADFELAAHDARRKRRADHRRCAERALQGAVRRVLRRRGRSRAADADHLGAHPALLQHAVLRLPVRHVLRVGGEDRRRDHGRRRGPRPAARDRYLELLAAGGSDHPMTCSRTPASISATRNGPGGRRSARRVGRELEELI
jgi:oligoendopeptidase F